MRRYFGFLAAAGMMAKERAAAGESTPPSLSLD
jgi:hypothetical protein